MLELAASPAAARLIATDGDSLRDSETGVRLRLENVDAPEINGECAAERDLARRAQRFTAEAMRQDPVVRYIGRRDRYGRELVMVEIPKRGDLGDLLIGAKLGRAYHGGRRGGWCDR